MHLYCIRKLSTVLFRQGRDFQIVIGIWSLLLMKVRYCKQVKCFSLKQVNRNLLQCNCEETNTWYVLIMLCGLVIELLCICLYWYFEFKCPTVGKTRLKQYWPFIKTCINVRHEIKAWTVMDFNMLVCYSMSMGVWRLHVTQDMTVRGVKKRKIEQREGYRQEDSSWRKPSETEACVHCVAPPHWALPCHGSVALVLCEVSSPKYRLSIEGHPPPALTDKGVTTLGIWRYQRSTWP